VALVPPRTVRSILDRCGEKRHRSLDGLKPSEFEALWDFKLEAGDLRSRAVTEALRMMDPAAVGKLLRAFGNPGIEKTAIRAIAVDAAAQAFANSIDPDKYRAARDRRRCEKYPFAFGLPTNP
jgi:cytochrome c1